MKTPFNVTTPAPTTSDRYSFFSTSDIIAEAAKSGFAVASTQVAHVRNPDHIPYARHVVRMRQKDSRVVGDVIPEIILTNDHMGRGALSFSAGLFRVVCSNGLVVPETTVSKFKIPHIRHELGDVIEGVWTVVSNMENAHQQIEQMKAKQLNEDEQMEFATRALALRTDVSVDPRKVIEPYRVDDIGDDLWRTFNRAQERLINGGINVQRKKGVRKLRRVTSLNGVQLNRDLWELAMAFAA